MRKPGNKKKNDYKIVPDTSGLADPSWQSLDHYLLDEDVIKLLGYAIDDDKTWAENNPEIASYYFDPNRDSFPEEATNRWGFKDTAGAFSNGFDDGQLDTEDLSQYFA